MSQVTGLYWAGRHLSIPGLPTITTNTLPTDIPDWAGVVKQQRHAFTNTAAATTTTTTTIARTHLPQPPFVLFLRTALSKLPYRAGHRRHRRHHLRHHYHHQRHQPRAPDKCNTLRYDSLSRTGCLPLRNSILRDREKPEDMLVRSRSAIVVANLVCRLFCLELVVKVFH
jgi:hypothetical protein